MEARIALADLLSVAGTFHLAGDGGWEPRKALQTLQALNAPADRGAGEPWAQEGC
jgi:hypothetical protein